MVVVLEKGLSWAPVVWVIVPSLAPPNCPVVVVPIVFPVPVESRFRPSWVSAVRSTSANLTCRSISSAPTGPKVRTFTTFLEYAAARAPACFETSSGVTCPERTIAERDGVTLICSSGKRRCISSVAAVMSTSTRRSKLRERSSSSQIRSETSPGARPLTSTCVGVTTKASATAGSVTETRFNLSVVLIRSDLPTMTRNGTAPAVTVCVDEVVDVVDGVASWLWGDGEVEEVAELAPEPAACTNSVVAPKSRTAAASLRDFMNRDLCEDARIFLSRKSAAPDWMSHRRLKTCLVPEIYFLPACYRESFRRHMAPQQSARPSLPSFEL